MKKLLFLLAISTLFGIEIPSRHLSSPEEILTLTSSKDFLVGGLVSPLTGQIALKIVDLVAKGAQPIFLDRLYLPFSPLPIQQTGNGYLDFLNKKFAAEYMKYEFRGGFRFLRGLYIRKFDDGFYYYDHSGVTLKFSFDGECLLSSYGGTNVSGDIPHGKFDIRNFRFKVFPNLISVYCPDGTVRMYESRCINGIDVYFLQNEILPNGKILKYELHPNHLVIKSLDPLEQFTYATVQIDWDQNLKIEKIAANGVDFAHFLFESLFKREEHFKGKVENKNLNEHFCLGMSPLMTRASTPFYRLQSMDYNPDLQLTAFSGKDLDFSLRYKEQSSQVEKIFLPVGEKGEMIDLYTMSYDSPKAGEKGGKTTVFRKDGAKIEYFFNSDLRMEKVLYFGTDSLLKKQKHLAWDEKGRLKDLSWKNGNGELFWGLKYSEYDSFSNPWLEIFYGDLSGEKHLEEWVTKKKYSQDGRNLLLKEETENKTVVYAYIPNTNLLKTKLTKENGTIVLREFRDYDRALNLIAILIDDGNTEEKENLTGVKTRKITRFHLRQKAPFLHMPEWVETYAWEGNREKLLNKKEFKYDKRGNVFEECFYDSNDQLAYKILREYDEQGNLLSETNPLGYTAIHSYTQKGQVESSVSYSGCLRIDKTYDARGRLTRVSETDLETDHSHRTHYDYNFLDRCIKNTDPFQQETKYEYDPISGGITVLEGPKLEAQQVKTLATFDGLGRKIAETDPNGHVTTKRYNAYGSIAEIIYPEGLKEAFTYYRNGLLKSHTDQKGLNIEYEYDLFHRMKKKKFLYQAKLIGEEVFIYDSFYLKKQIDLENYVTEFEYDSAGRKSKEIKLGRLGSTSQPRITTFTYNPLGYLETVSESDLVITKYQRDALGQILEESKVDPSGKVLAKVGYEWDPNGMQKATIRYPQNIEAKEICLRDAFGRIVEVLDPLGCATTTVYEETSHLKTVSTNPIGIRTEKTFDPYGRLSTLKIGNEKKQKNTYDPAGNLIKIQEGMLSTFYEYDDLNRVTSLTRAYSSSDQRTTQYRYNPCGELAEKILPDGTILAFTYTPLGHLCTLDASDDSVHQTFTTDLYGRIKQATDGKSRLIREFDDFGNTKSEMLNGLILTKTYDSLNRVTSITLPDRSSIVYSYRSIYPEKVQRFSSGLKKQYEHTYTSFDLAGNLLKEEPIYPLSPRTYTWDLAGRQTSIACDEFSQSIGYDVASQVKWISSDGAYEYNDRSELTQEILKKGVLKYEYDMHQNRTLKNGIPTHYNLLDELVRFEHDERGNLKKNGKFCYEYDALNRLIEAKSGDTCIKFTYDALDRLIEKSTNGTKQFFQYLGMEELGSFHEDGTFYEVKVPGLTHNPIAIELQSVIYAPISDFRGDIRRLVSKSNTQSYDYTVFGEEITELQKPFNPWRYSAKRFDPSLQLTYFGKRFYEPFLGRWITTDPAGFIDGTNLYAYACNNPLSYRDQDGRFIIAIPLIALTWETVFYASIAFSAAYATSGMIESSMYSGKLPQIAGEIATGVLGGVAGGVVGNLDINLDISPSTSPQVWSTGYGGFVYTHGNTVHSSLGSYYKNNERISSDKPGSPPYRGDKLPSDGATQPAEGFEWKGKGPPGSGQGKWVKGPKGESQEGLFPDLNHGPPHGAHWDYHGPGFPNGARLYPDGTWSSK